MKTFTDEAGIAPPMPKAGGRTKPRLAVVSTYDELCGIAAYTVYLKQQLDEHFDVTVFELDQFFLRHENRRVRKLGDNHIKTICQQLKAFDAVNIQLEYGTIGRLDEDIVRRFRWLVKAAPRLSVTFHTILEPESFGFFELMGGLRKWQLLKTWNSFRAARRSLSLSGNINGMLRQAQFVKPVSVIVHTRRDMRMMRYVNRLNEVYDHPLAAMSAAQSQQVRATASRASFPLLRELPGDAKLVGVFGFLGPYKGFETAIRALQHLPETHHLLIFGGIHPQTIRKGQKIDPYIQQLLTESYVDTNVVERLSEGSGAKSGASAVSVNLTIDAEMAKLLESHPRDLSRRVHFMGALPDDEFARGMAICDTVVFPYLEVGQTSSGPIGRAIELGKRVIASRTLAYLQLARYHKNAIEFFDIGNHLELAQRIMADAAYPDYAKNLQFDTISNMDIYLSANGQQPVGQKVAV